MDTDQDGTLVDSGDPGLTGEREWDWNDNPVTPMPKYCRVWPCSVKKHALKNVGGYMCCPVCGASYGTAEEEQ